MTANTRARQPEVIPTPRRVRIDSPIVMPNGFSLSSIDSDIAEFEDVVLALLSRLGDGLKGDRPGAPVTVTHDASLPVEGYRLSMKTDGSVSIAAADSLAVLHACQTLGQWIAQSPINETWSAAIEDWPDQSSRGIFVESFWGSDLMELSDWCALVDRLSALKLNILAISIYGCWDLRHDTDRGEYLFVPLDGYPELSTPHRFERWNSQLGAGEFVEYLPRMFEADFFGDVVKYATQRGIEVIPFIAGPGHSSLIPRVVPALSAVTAEGEATGYGYCMTNPDSLAALGSLLRSVVHQHVLSNGIRRIGIQGDEFFPIRNLDPLDPFREVSPYCQCDGCSALTPGELLVSYMKFAGEIASEFGVGLVHWHDSLVREHVLSEYENSVANSAVSDVTVSWWGYNDPLPEVQTSPQWQTWVTPTTGLIASLFPQDFTLNIEQWMREARRVNADGVLAYTTYHPAGVRNYAALADMAWGGSGAGGRAGFLERWSRIVGATDPGQASLSAQIADSVFASYPLMTYLIQQTLPYFATAAAGDIDYVPELMATLAPAFPALENSLRQSRDTLHTAITTMPPLNDIPAWADLDLTWRSEVNRTINHLDLVLGALELTRRISTESMAEILDDVEAWEVRARHALDEVTRTSPSWLAPIVSREHLELLRDLRPTLESIAAGHRAPIAADRPYHAWLF